MNSFFHEKLNKFVIIYIDDILVNSRTIEKYVERLKHVCNKLELMFFGNRVKSKLAQEEMNLFGHVLTWEGVRFNLKKFEAQGIHAKINHNQKS